MDKDNVYKKDGENIFRTSKTHNIGLRTDFIDSDYIIEISEKEMTETGFLPIFTIRHKSDKNAPYFVGRWDQFGAEILDDETSKHREAGKGTLDVDIQNVEKSISTLFKSEEGGYSGHHPKRVAHETRTFELKIETPEKKYFFGYLTFNIAQNPSPQFGITNLVIRTRK